MLLSLFFLVYAGIECLKLTHQLNNFRKEFGKNWRNQLNCLNQTFITRLSFSTEGKLCNPLKIWAGSFAIQVVLFNTLRNALQTQIVQPSHVTGDLMPASLSEHFKPPLILSSFTVSAILSAVCNHGGCCVWYSASAAFLYLQLDARRLPQFASADCYQPCFTVLILN